MAPHRSYRTLELEREGPVLRVWLNRPERLNAINNDVLREVGDLFQALDTDFETRVVVLGGRGRAFCAGFDRKPPDPGAAVPAHEPSDRERRWLSQLGRRASRAIEECEVLTVARIHGHAVGGGAVFAAACDFRIATRDARIRVPEVALGIPLSWGATPRLIHEIGAARTRELLLLCEDVDGVTAERWNLVHRAVEPDQLDAEVARVVEALLERPELAVHMTKTQLRGYARRDALGDATETDGDMVAVAFRSAESRSRFGMPDEPKG